MVFIRTSLVLAALIIIIVAKPFTLTITTSTPTTCRHHHAGSLGSNPTIYGPALIHSRRGVKPVNTGVKALRADDHRQYHDPSIASSATPVAYQNSTADSWKIIEERLELLVVEDSPGDLEPTSDEACGENTCKDLDSERNGK